MRSRHLPSRSSPPSIPLSLPVDTFIPPSICTCPCRQRVRSLVCMRACDFFPCVYVCARNPSPTEMSVEPWAGTRDQAAAEDTHSTSEASSQDQQEHPDKLCLDSFWSEVETIRQGCGYPDPDCTRRDSRQSEGARVSDRALVRFQTKSSCDTDRIPNIIVQPSEVTSAVIQSEWHRRQVSVIAMTTR